MRRNLQDEYFEWMYHIACDGRFAEENSYRKLLVYLHSREFTWTIPKDSNRAEDGKDLRWRFVYENHIHIDDELEGPCSVLEMILALAIRCEESIMDDPAVGDRTGQWFWKMITNLGLGGMSDRMFDIEYAEDVVTRFLERDFAPDGQGGLFTIRNCGYDMRKIEFWICLMWYLDNII